MMFNTWWSLIIKASSCRTRWRSYLYVHSVISGTSAGEMKLAVTILYRFRDLEYTKSFRDIEGIEASSVYSEIGMEVTLINWVCLPVVTIYLYVWSRDLMRTPGYHHDGFIASPELVRRTYLYTLLVSKNQRLLTHILL